MAEKQLQSERLSISQHLISGKKFKFVLITVLLSILGYFLFTLWAGWENVLNTVKQAGFIGILSAFVLSLMNYALRFSRWQYFLHTLGYSIPWKESLKIYMAGFSLTTTPGKSGEALRGVFLKDFGVPFRKSFGAFLSERTSDLISVTIMASAGLWIYPAGKPVLFLVVLVMGFLFFAVRKDTWLQKMEKIAKKILPEKFALSIEFFLEIVKSFRVCFTARVLFVTLLLGVAAWTIEAMALYYLLHLLGYGISPITAIFIYGFSLVVGGITLLPGGLGGAEITMIQLLILQNVPASAAVAVTLTIRITSLWFSVLLGMAILLKKNYWGSLTNLK